MNQFEHQIPWVHCYGRILLERALFRFVRYCEDGLIVAGRNGLKQMRC